MSRKNEYAHGVSGTGCAEIADRFNPRSASTSNAAASAPVRCGRWTSTERREASGVTISPGVTATNRVMSLRGVSQMFGSRMASPLSCAASFEQMAAFAGFPAALTMPGANAVLSAGSIRQPCRPMIFEHCAKACGWLTTVRMSSVRAPGNPARQCSTYRSVKRATNNPRCNKRYTVSTAPPDVFRSGSTAASHSPAANASHASGNVRRGTRSASGNIRFAAISEKDPAVPPNDTRRTAASDPSAVSGIPSGNAPPAS